MSRCPSTSGRTRRSCACRSARTTTRPTSSARARRAQTAARVSRRTTGVAARSPGRRGRARASQLAFAEPVRLPPGRALLPYGRASSGAGYDDQGPLTPLLGWLSEALFGETPRGLRVVSALAASRRRRARRTPRPRARGGRPGQLVAAVGTAASGFVLAVGHLLEHLDVRPPRLGCDAPRRRAHPRRWRRATLARRRSRRRHRPREQAASAPARCRARDRPRRRSAAAVGTALAVALGRHGRRARDLASVPRLAGRHTAGRSSSSPRTSAATRQARAAPTLVPLQLLLVGPLTRSGARRRPVGAASATRRCVRGARSALRTWRCSC